MGSMKTIHFFTAIVFTLSVISRVIWMFMGNRYARWDKFIPIEKRRLSGLWDSLRYYLFQLRQPPGFVGHNPLAGFTYTLRVPALLHDDHHGARALQRERAGGIAVPGLPLPAAALGRRPERALASTTSGCG